MAGEIYSKDPKLKQEIISARNYNINWAKKRKSLLKKNIEELRLVFPMFINPGLGYLSQKLVTPIEVRMTTNDRIKGYLNATVYGDPKSFMEHNPDSPYTKNALAYMKKHGENRPELGFNAVNTINGATFGTNRLPRIYLKDGRSGSAAHEFWHAGTRRTSTNSMDGGSYKTDPYHFAVVKYLKQDPYIKKLLTTKQLDWDAPATTRADDYNYVWNPDEVLARRASLMHYLNWDPTKKATLKDVQEWRRKGLLDWEKSLENNPTFYNTPNVNLSRLSDETILHLINDVALNNTPSQDTYLPNDVYYAYKGGLITKLTK